MGILISWNAFLNKYDVVVYVLVTYKIIYKKNVYRYNITYNTLNKLYVYRRRRRYLQYLHRSDKRLSFSSCVWLVTTTTIALTITTLHSRLGNIITMSLCLRTVQRCYLCNILYKNNKILQMPPFKSPSVYTGILYKRIFKPIGGFSPNLIKNNLKYIIFSNKRGRLDSSSKDENHNIRNALVYPS